MSFKLISLTVVSYHILYNWYTTADNRNYTEIAINFIHKVRQSHNMLAIAAAGPIVWIRKLQQRRHQDTILELVKPLLLLKTRVRLVTLLAALCD